MRRTIYKLIKKIRKIIYKLIKVMSSYVPLLHLIRYLSTKSFLNHNPGLLQTIRELDTKGFLHIGLHLLYRRTPITVVQTLIDTIRHLHPSVLFIPVSDLVHRAAAPIQAPGAGLTHAVVHHVPELIGYLNSYRCKSSNKLINWWTPITTRQTFVHYVRKLAPSLFLYPLPDLLLCRTLIPTTSGEGEGHGGDCEEENTEEPHTDYLGHSCLSSIH